MSVRTKSRSRAAARRPAANRQSANGHDALTMKAWSGYEGSNFSPSRGFVYFPTLDTKRDLDDYTLYELRRRSRWLYINSGFTTRIINGIANMVGSLTPVPQTGDKEWNQLAIKSFTNNFGSANVFDVAGKFNFWSAQPMMGRCRMIDGDILTVLTESQGGMARSMFYEAHQLGNAETTLAQDQWINGVRSTPQNRVLQYRLLTDPGAYGDSGNQGQKSQDIDAADAILLANLLRPCRQRGEPVLRHAINHLLDRAEIMGFMKQGLKNTNQIGYYLARTAAFTGPSTLPALGAGPIDQTLADGVTKVKVEEAFRGGKVPGLAPGEDIKMLLDQRPHPNQVEYLDYLNRDISWGTDFSSDVLWNITKLGGATVRYVLADAQANVEAIQELNADQWCSREWIYYIAKELKTGRLRPCQDPEWWQHGWQPQQKLTVDIGRDGRLYIDMHKSGLISLKRFHSQQGRNWQVESDDYLNERQYIIEGVLNRMIKLPDGTTRPMTMEEAFPPGPGAANITLREQDAAPGGDLYGETVDGEKPAPAPSAPISGN